MSRRDASSVESVSAVPEARARDAAAAAAAQTEQLRAVAQEKAAAAGAAMAAAARIQELTASVAALEQTAAEMAAQIRVLTAERDGARARVHDLEEERRAREEAGIPVAAALEALKRYAEAAALGGAGRGAYAIAFPSPPVLEFAPSVEVAEFTAGLERTWTEEERGRIGFEAALKAATSIAVETQLPTFTALSNSTAALGGGPVCGLQAAAAAAVAAAAALPYGEATRCLAVIAERIAALKALLPDLSGTMRDFEARAHSLEAVVDSAEGCVARLSGTEIRSDEELDALYGAEEVLNKRVVELAEAHRQRLLAVFRAQGAYERIRPLCEETRRDGDRAMGGQRVIAGHVDALAGAIQVRAATRPYESGECNQNGCVSRRRAELHPVACFMSQTPRLRGH